MLWWSSLQDTTTRAPSQYDRPVILPSLPPTLRRHNTDVIGEWHWYLYSRRSVRRGSLLCVWMWCGREETLSDDEDGVPLTPSLCLWLRVWIRKWLWLIFFRWHVPTSSITPLTGLFHTILNFFNNSTVHIHVHFLLIIVDCLLWIEKTRDKDKTYIWVSVWWKTTN